MEDRAGRAGKGLSNNILRARDVDNIAGKFENIGKIVLLSGGPQRRGAEKGQSERLMIGEKGKLMGFEEKIEMAD